MPATFPAANVDGDDRFPQVEIGLRTLRFGDTVFDIGNHDPAFVLKNGVEIRTGDHIINRLTVTFLVGQIDVTDEALKQIRVTPDAS